MIYRILLLVACLLLPASAFAQGGPNILKLINEPSGVAPRLSASGVDTNIDVNIVPKGAGCVRISGGACIGGGGGSGTVSPGTTHMVPAYTNGPGAILGNSLSFYDAGSSGVCAEAGCSFIGDPSAFVSFGTFISSTPFVTATTQMLGRDGLGSIGEVSTFGGNFGVPGYNGSVEIIANNVASMANAAFYHFEGPGAANAFYVFGGTPSLGTATSPWVSTVTKILNVPETAAGSLSAAGFGVLYADSTSHTFKVSNNGGAFVALGTGTVTSIATTSPITGGTITTTGTLACATCVTSAASLTLNLPVFGAGGQATAVGTVTGNTTKVATSTGALTSGHGATWDASGNIVDSGAAPTSGTVTSIATTSPIAGGTITATGTITCATCVTAASALTSNQITKGGGSQALVADSLLTDDGTTLTYAGTGGIKSSGAANGSITFGNTSNSNLVTIKSGVTSATYTLTAPTTLGTTGQVVSLADNTGTLQFSTVSGGTAITANARNSATQSISDSTVTALTFNTDIDNPQGIHSTSSNTSRMTITTPGIYSVTGRWAPAASAVGTRFCILLVTSNGGGTTTRMAETQFPAPAAGAPILECTGIWRFAATDFVELDVFQNSGGALNSTVDSNITPSLSVVFLGS